MIVLIGFDDHLSAYIIEDNDAQHIIDTDWDTAEACKDFIMTAGECINKFNDTCDYDESADVFFDASGLTDDAVALSEFKMYLADLI